MSRVYLLSPVTKDAGSRTGIRVDLPGDDIATRYPTASSPRQDRYLRTSLRNVQTTEIGRYLLVRRRDV